MKEKFDYYMIGAISLDRDTYMDGTTRKYIGGAIPFGVYAALQSQKKVGVLSKLAPEDQFITDLLYVKGLTMLDSKNSQVSHLVYKTANKERRDQTITSACDPFYVKDIPDIESKIFHLAGLTYGDFGSDLFPYLAERGQLACDLQGFLRHNNNGTIEYGDWPDKLTCLPYVTYLKADAAEAEVITGLSDRRAAAEQLYQWGAKEIIITHNSEVLVYDGKAFYAYPIRSRSLAGRSGRGDSTFSSYLTERLERGIDESLFYATSLVSLKMETPGPFKGTRQDVLDYQKELFSDFLANR